MGCTSSLLSLIRSGKRAWTTQTAAKLREITGFSVRVDF